MWHVVLSDTAIRHWKGIPKSKRGLVRDGIQRHLAREDPFETTRNKFRLRRASEFAEYEFRLDPWRVFYRVRGKIVEVVMIGEKKGNKLLIGGEEFIL